MFKEFVEQYILHEKLLTPQDVVLVALSGGADSMALLCVLHELGYKCIAAHCNFHLRGEESNRDEQFVRAHCEKKHIKLYVTHFQTNEYAQSHKISIEMAARELRYNWFEQIRKEYNAKVIAVAHHQDDSVETILLNLIRGTGITGLQGIQPKNGNIVRPLLCVTRNQILGYLTQQEVGYVTDSTNLQDEYTRNKIRLRILPEMEVINNAVKNNIASTGNYLRGVAAIYNTYIKEVSEHIYQNNCIHIPSLLQTEAPENILFELLYPQGFTPAQITTIYNSLKAQSGKRFYSKNGICLVKDRDELILFNEPENSITDKPDFELSYQKKRYTAAYQIPKGKTTIAIDAAKLKGDFTIRRWQQGDIFYPFGMKGKKLVSDYMTNRKYSLVQKKNQWILISGKEIVWLIGERSDNRFRIDDATKDIIEISIQQEDIE